MTAKVLRCGTRELALDRPLVMGILNVTPDSFSDGGRHADVDAALAAARAMVHAGVDIVDVGGESTRPGAEPVDADEERRRVLPVVRAISAELDVVISVDTSRPELMEASAAAGAGLINDVRALREPGALEVAAATGLPVCLMHMRGEPGTMQDDVAYADVRAEVTSFLEARAAAARAAGIAARDIVLDPGFGFGKRTPENLALFDVLEDLSARWLTLAGLSRKRMIGELGDPEDTLRGRPDERLGGSIAAALVALERGAGIVRVHDVEATVQAVRVWHALRLRR